MAITLPTGYTDEALAALMAGWLGRVATRLGWTYEAGSYDAAILQTLAMYGGITDLSGATDTRKLLALAEYAAWKSAVGSLVPQTDWTRGGESVRSQTYKNAQTAMMAAYAAAVAAGYVIPASTINVIDVEYNDPYQRVRRSRY